MLSIAATPSPFMSFRPLVCCRPPIRRFHYLHDDVPTFMTIEQAAKLLQIGRSKAYELAAEWEHTRGVSDLPAVRIAHQKRVPREALERYIDGLLHPAGSSRPASLSHRRHDPSRRRGGLHGESGDTGESAVARHTARQPGG